VQNREAGGDRTPYPDDIHVEEDALEEASGLAAEAEVDNDLNAGFADRPLKIPAHGIKVLAIPCSKLTKLD
jgi:hypothetical protein